MAALEEEYDYSDAAILKATRAQIMKITMGAQEYYFSSERVRKAELNRLWEQVRELEQRIAATTAGSTTNLGSYRRDP